MDDTDQIFKDLVTSTRLGRDRELLALLEKHNSPQSPLYQDVLDLVNSIDVHDFEKVSSQKQENVLSSGEDTFRKSLEPNSRTSNGNNIIHREVPQLTQTQRRMSFELMQMNPAMLNSSVLLAKPAKSAVSTVNVVTKVTDLENRGYVPIVPTSTRKAFKNKIMSYQDRFKLVNRQKVAMKDENKQGKNKLPHTENGQIGQVGIKRGNTTIVGTSFLAKALDSNKIVPIKDLNLPETNKSSKTDKLIDQNTKVIRRVSLVNENLPLYIRQQLQKERQELYSTPLNAIENSVIEDDVAELDTLQMQNSESSDSFHENNTSIGNNGSTISDADKEYILPSLFNRYLDYGHDDLDTSNMSLSEGHMDDENDDEDTDNYLFNSQAV